mmetsp:Transcript_70863/g.200806  ORF Transcript_70863/g.200806 Transcript_70863/m.200806 type:complete len:313 (+) Transcript_70863:3636-4574(+)
MFVCFRASMILFCASPADVSISSIAFFRVSPSSSRGSAMSGSAMAWTESTESSARVTSSITAGSASESSLPSRSSACLFCSCSSACFLAVWALSAAFCTCPLSLVISDVMLACRALAFGISFDSSLTELLTAQPPFLTSLMSCIRDFGSSISMVSCFCKSSCTWVRVSSAHSPVISSLALVNASVAAASAASTCSVAFWTRAWAAALVTGPPAGEIPAPAAAAAAGATGAPPALPGGGTTWFCIFPPGSTGWALYGSTKRTPSSALAASQGIFHPTRGGVGVCEGLLAHTWEPPSWSPNHHPLKSAPSRWSQ